MRMTRKGKESSTSSIHPATPYNSIRKQIKPASIKYLKHRQKKKGEKVNKPSFEDSANTSFEFFNNTESKISEISEKCSEIKSEAETVSKLEEGQDEEVFSHSQADPKIEYSSMYVCLRTAVSILLISRHPRAC